MLQSVHHTLSLPLLPPHTLPLLYRGSLPRGHKPCQQTCSGVGSSFHGSAGPARSLLQHGALHGVIASFRHPPAPAWGSFHWLQVDLCSGAWSTFSPSPSLTLMSAELFHIFSLSAANAVMQVFSPFLNCVVPEVLPPLLMGSALASSGSVLELAGTASVGHRGSFSQLSTEATPVAPTLPKPCHTNLIHILILFQCPSLANY